MPEHTSLNHRRLRWYQFSLRSLLIFIILSCVFFAWLGNGLRQSEHERQVSEQLRKQGVGFVLTGHPYATISLNADQQLSISPPTLWGDICKSLVGKRILSIHIAKPDNLSPTIQVASKGNSPVHRFQDLTHLAELSNLQWLDLRSSNVIDLSPIASVSTLKFLDVRNTKVNKEQVENLKEALPECRIEHDPFPVP